MILIGLIRAGDVTLTLVGLDPLIINIKGDTKNEQAGNISIYMYFCDDGVTDLEENSIDVAQLTGNQSGQFGWTTLFEKIEIQGEGQQIGGGPWIRNGYTFTKRLLYDNADIGSQDDFWTTEGINAIIGNFTSVGSGHAFIELAGSDGLADYNGIPHNVSFENQTIPLPVEATITVNFPKVFQLHPNYPNPFNPTTTLRFDIPLKGSGLVDTRLVIYNSLGQAIRTLNQDKLSAGSYEVQWDGKSDFGYNVPSGFYFARFKANGFYQTRKLVLVK